MVQLPPHLHGLLADLFPLFQDPAVPSVILVCGDHVVDGLVIPLVIVIIYPLPDPFGQLGGRIVIVQKDQVLHRPMVPLDLPLGHGMIHLRPNMPDFMGLEIFLQLMRDETGPVVAEKPRLLDHLDMLDPGFAMAMSSVFFTSSAFLVRQSCQAMI